MYTKVTVYIPDHDCHAAPIPQDEWVERFAKLFSRIAGGATIIPNAHGVWLEGDMLIYENVAIVYCLMKDDFYEGDIRFLVSKFRLNTNQSAVMYEIGDQVYLDTAATSSTIKVLS